MFELNIQNTKNKTYWLKIIDTESSIILTHIKEAKVIDLRIFNKNTIYHMDFKVKGKKISFIGDLSPDGNEFDIECFTKKDSLQLNVYYNLNKDLVVSILEKGRRRELVTLPNALLN